MNPPGIARIEPIADDALLLHLGDRIEPSTNARVHAVCEQIRAQRPAWLRDLVPAYASIGVFFDPLLIEVGMVEEWLHACVIAQPAASQSTSVAARIVEIPVIYGGEAGPDLESAAAELGLTAAQLAQRHAAGEYTVAMIGFAPGFPYLLGLDPALHLPRLATPRTSVPAGSVGIGGAQTGIYPRESPGGWRLIGRTPLVLFDPSRDPPALLAPGDRVRFVAVDGAT